MHSWLSLYGKIHYRLTNVVLLSSYANETVCDSGAYPSSESTETDNSAAKATGRETPPPSLP